MKIGLFNKDNYKTENVIDGLATIPLRNVYLILMFGVLFGSPVTIVSMLYILIYAKNDSLLPIVVVFVCGVFSFLFAMSLPYLVILSKEIQQLKQKLQAIENKKER